MLYMSKQKLTMIAEQPTLPIPDTTLWITPRGAAERLGFQTYRSVMRLIKAGTLHAYAPYAGKGETAPVLLYLPEVNELAHARAVSGIKGAKRFGQE